MILLLGWYTSLDLADLRPRAQGGQPQITLLDRAGTSFASFGERYGDYLTLDQMSPWLPKAVIAIEDRRFYQHPGLDPIGILRALVRNLQAGHVVQGGSTISQQLAKLAFLTPERSLVAQAQGSPLHAVDRGPLRQGARSSRPISTGSISAAAPMASTRRRGAISPSRRARSPSPRRRCWRA